MVNKTENVKNLITYSGGGILSKQISPDATLFCMSASASISEHTSTRKAIVYVVEGMGSFMLEGEAIEMSPGTIITMPENAVHAISAHSDLSFILFLF